MDYFKIDQSNDIDAVQSNHNQNIDLKQKHFIDQINVQNNSEQQRGSNERTSYAKNESNLLQHHLRSISMPHKKQLSEPKNHKQLITDSSSKYLEVESCIDHLNEKHDASFTKHSNDMQSKYSVLTIPKAFSGNMLDNKNEILNSNFKALADFKITLTANTINAEELMHNRPVNVEKFSNIPMTSKRENSLNYHNLEILKDNAMFHKPCEANQLLHRSACNKFDDYNTQKSIIGSNQDVPYTVDENEIAENIAKGRNESNEKNNHMTKKQLQILMSRSCAEPNSNCSLENNLINDNDHVRVKTKIHEVNVDATHNTIFFDTSKVSENNNKTNNLVNDNCSLKAMQEIGSETTTDKVEVKTPDKIRFEEIENKLEEMFAGIEDEQLIHSTNSKNNSHTSSTKIGNDFELDDMTKEIIRDEILTAKVGYENDNELLLPINSSHQTKAEKKSTDSNIYETNKIESEKAILPKAIDAQKFQNTVPPHRRLSVGIDPALFRISLVSRTDKYPNHKKPQNDKEGTSNRNKIKKNSKNSSENKREITYSKSLFSNKRKQFKSDPQGGTPKLKQQPVKHRNIHTISLENDNDPEERTQQARELDNKIRSPFILVKHNGTITVVNAPTIDDLNEKNTKAKKTCTFVHERKNVRGCHSSTLSNRYDAETADSSWICVFCKQGPHKKGLGDLFGPYIISIDCEEYQSAIDVYTHDSSALFIKRRRIEPSLVTEKTQTRHANEAVIQTDLSKTQQNMSDCYEDTSFHKFSLGMTRISDISFEIWLHEDCAIWAPNLFVIGSRLVGLEAAIWNSTRYICVFCSKPGASLCCLQRECKLTAHVPCARQSNWALNELTFWSHCKNHVSKIFSTSSSNYEKAKM